jgi:hypothetical protein
MQLAKKKKGKRKTRCRTLKHFRGVVLIRVALARDWDLVADLLKGRTRVQVHNTAGHDCKELRDALVLWEVRGFQRAWACLFDPMLYLGNAVHVRQLL